MPKFITVINAMLAPVNLKLVSLDRSDRYANAKATRMARNMDIAKKLIEAAELGSVDMPKLSDRLRVARGNQTRRQLAERMGVSEQSIQRFENGTRTPQKHYLVKLAQECKVSLTWIMHSTGAPDPTTNTEEDRHA